MKQLFQNLNNGKVTLEQIPSPTPKKGEILIKTLHSLISPGTERMLSTFGKSNLIEKAKSQPDKVKQVLQKVKTEGLISTINTVKAKLGEPLQLGYCNVGEVVEVGEGVNNFKVGNIVTSNGPHSEFICVSENLAAKVPESVSPKDASITVLGSIALQGVRLSKPELGETFVVVGLGIIGLLTVQILKANGVDVIAFDYNQKRVEVANKIGAKAFEISSNVSTYENVLELTNKVGADAVIVTTATSSNQPIDEAPKMLRARGRIILTGVSGININRNDFYKKEISFQVSCSYGAGRYESNYEEKNLDYPIGHVRWTENRNFQAILNLLEKKLITPKLLINHEISFNEAQSEYDKVLSSSEYLGVLFNYQNNNDYNAGKTIEFKEIKNSNSSQVNVGIIGAGNFARATLLPALTKSSVNLISIASASGKAAAHMAKKYGFNYCTSDYKKIINDPNINTVFILTRHNDHAKICIEALDNNKHVFLEKPLCLNESELIEIEKVKAKKPKLKLMLGFNRRFSPLTTKAKNLISEIKEPIAINIQVNAGALPSDFWLNDPEIGGGRLIGEACHFIDLASYLSNSKVIEKNIVTAPSTNNYNTPETFSINFRYKNDSIANVNYFSNGSKNYPKEKITIFGGEKIIEIENFKVIKSYGFKKDINENLSKLNKGHKEGVFKFIESIKENKKTPIQFSNITEVTHLTFDKKNNQTCNL